MSDAAPIQTAVPSISERERAVALERVNRTRGRTFAMVSEWAKSFVIAVVVFLFVRAFFVEAFRIPTGSMENTLRAGDFLLVNKLVYGAEVPFTSRHLPAIRRPRDGDVIVFLYPKDLSKNFVKRLVGVPGDTLSMRNGTLIRNGASVREHYVQHSEPAYDAGSDDFSWQRDFLVQAPTAPGAYHPSRDNWGPLIVPPRNYFMLGDNRDNSLDSRYWGFVADSLIRGEPLFVYYSYDPDSTVTTNWLERIRWNRFGSRVQ